MDSGSDQECCATAGVPAERRDYRSKTGLALDMLEQAVELGHLKAGWVAGDDAFGMSTSSRDGLAVLGISCVLDVQAGFTVWPSEPECPPPPGLGRRGAAAYHDGAHLILCSLMISARG